MKTFTTPGPAETRQILIRMRVNKAARHKGRAAIELIKARLENAKEGKSTNSQGAQ